ncbi:hypothetical protein [Microbacterium algeriense]|uniref:hypothetical protein n=1 Tax=Microbacterium algeriense TaxID=2615184 RepID=UPI0022E7123A|nr:hypothetical protein [Microbacterium algeriense]
MIEQKSTSAVRGLVWRVHPHDSARRVRRVLLRTLSGDELRNALTAAQSGALCFPGRSQEATVAILEEANHTHLRNADRDPILEREQLAHLGKISLIAGAFFVVAIYCWVQLYYLYQL